MEDGECRDAFELPGCPALLCCPGVGQDGGGRGGEERVALWCRANRRVSLRASSSERQIWERNDESVAQLCYSSTSYVQQVTLSVERRRSRSSATGHFSILFCLIVVAAASTAMQPRRSAARGEKLRENEAFYSQGGCIVPTQPGRVCRVWYGTAVETRRVLV